MTEIDKQENVYAEASPFVRLLETKSRVRILDVFLGKHYEELTASDVSELAGIDRSSFSRHIGTFLSIGIIEEAGQVGSTTTYRLNTDHPVAKAFGKARAELIAHSDDIRDDHDKRLPFKPSEVEVNKERDPKELREEVGLSLGESDA